MLRDLQGIINVLFTENDTNYFYLSNMFRDLRLVRITVTGRINLSTLKVDFGFPPGAAYLKY